MLKKTLSEKKQLGLYVFMFAASGFVLFIFTALFYKPFEELVIVLNSKPIAPLNIWLSTGLLGLILGLLWLGIFIIFESAKKGLLDLIFKK